MYSMILKVSVVMAMGPIDPGRTSSCHHGRLWWCKQQQNPHNDDTRSPVDELQYTIYKII